MSLENLQSKNLSPSSLKLYLSNLSRLNNGEDIKNFSFLKPVDKIMEKIAHYKPNTQRTYIISIVSLLKQEPKLSSLYDKYYQILIKFNTMLKTNTEKSTTQTENWISQSEVKQLFDEKLESVNNSIGKLKKLSEPIYLELLNFVILAVYVLQSPRRNLDYLYMLVIPQYSETESKKFNYLSIGDGTFYFNNFKTAKTYKTQSVPIAPELFTIIKKYLSFHPNKLLLKTKNYKFPFLVDYHGQPFDNTNTITRSLNKTFGKKIGCSMLRNIYLTDKFSPKVQELNQDVANMGTSVNTSLNNYIKIDPVNSNKKITIVDDTI